MSKSSRFARKIRKAKVKGIDIDKLYPKNMRGKLIQKVTEKIEFKGRVGK